VNLVKFGCGCIGVDLGSGKQLVVESCYGDNDYPALNLKMGELILERNLPGTPVDGAERIVGEINHLMMLGRRFETLQQTLGIEVKK
jgi:hypothetical protein